MSTVDKIIEVAERNQAVKEELVEAFFMDSMSQLNGLDPTEDGDELLTMVRETLEDPEAKKATRLFSFLLGCPLEEWLEEFSTE